MIKIKYFLICQLSLFIMNWINTNSSFVLACLAFISLFIGSFAQGQQADLFLAKMGEKIKLLAKAIQTNYANFDEKCEIKSYDTCVGVSQLKCYQDFTYTNDPECLSQGSMLSLKSGVQMSKDINPQNLTDEQKHVICSSAKIQPQFDELEATRNHEYAWASFGSNEGIYRGAPTLTLTSEQKKQKLFCDDFDARWRPWYIKALTGKKNFGIIIDASGQQNIFEAAIKMAAKEMVTTFNKNDQAMVATSNNEIHFLTQENVIQFSPEQIDKINEKIDKITFKGQFIFKNFQKILKEFVEAQKNSFLCCKYNHQNHIIILLFSNHASSSNQSLSEIIKSYKTIKIQLFIVSFDQKNSDNEYLTKLSCNFNGAYYLLDSTASKHQIINSLQKMYTFLASNKNNMEISWSNIYKDYIMDKELVTIVKPVYYLYNENFSYFLGVVGLDVEIQKLYDLGVEKKQIQRRLFNFAEYEIGNNVCDLQYLRSFKCNCKNNQNRKINFPQIKQSVFVEKPQVTEIPSYCCGIRRGQLLAIIITVSVLVAIAIGIFIFCCVRRIRKKKKQQMQKQEKQQKQKQKIDSERVLSLNKQAFITSQSQLLFPPPPQHLLHDD